MRKLLLYPAPAVVLLCGNRDLPDGTITAPEDLLRKTSLPEWACIPGSGRRRFRTASLLRYADRHRTLDELRKKGIRDPGYDFLLRHTRA